MARPTRHCQACDINNTLRIMPPTSAPVPASNMHKTRALQGRDTHCLGCRRRSHLLGTQHQRGKCLWLAGLRALVNQHVLEAQRCQARIATTHTRGTHLHTHNAAAAAAQPRQSTQPCSMPSPHAHTCEASGRQHAATNTLRCVKSVPSPKCLPNTGTTCGCARCIAPKPKHCPVGARPNSPHLHVPAPLPPVSGVSVQSGARPGW